MKVLVANRRPVVPFVELTQHDSIFHIRDSLELLYLGVVKVVSCTIRRHISVKTTTIAVAAEEQLWTYCFVSVARYALPKVKAFIETALELVQHYRNDFKLARISSQEELRLFPRRKMPAVSCSLIINLSRTNLLARRVERHRLCGKDVAFGVHQLNSHLVLAARHSPQDDGVALTVIRPKPRQVVDRDVQMTNSWRHAPCGSPAHRQDAQVLHPVRDEHDALGQRTRKRRLDDQAWARARCRWGRPCSGRKHRWRSRCLRPACLIWFIAFSPFEIRSTADDAHVARHPLVRPLNYLADYRSDLNPARRSSTIACGCSHAAKCAPFGMAACQWTSLG